MSSTTDNEYRSASDLLTSVHHGQAQIPSHSAYAQLHVEMMQIFRDIRAELRKLNGTIAAAPKPSSVTLQF